jgi:small subunit ribosomal protein S8
MTDPIADMLTRLRNAARARKTEFTVPYSKLKSEIARILEKEGYIAGFELETEEKGHPHLKIKNKFVNKTCAIAGLKRVSKPGLRRYVGATEKYLAVLGGMGIAVLSITRSSYRPRGTQAERWRGTPRLYLVGQHVTHRQKTHRSARQGQSQRGRRRRCYRRGAERQAFVDPSEGRPRPRGWWQRFP